MKPNDRHLCIGAATGGAAIGALHLLGSWVTLHWFITYGVLAAMALLALNEALKAKRLRQLIAPCAVLLVCTAGLACAATIGLNEAGAAQRQKAAAKAQAERLYPEVLAELTRQGFVPEVYSEVPSSDKRLEELSPDAVRVFLKHRATRVVAVLNVYRTNHGWIVVCPLADGGWLAAHERNNWLATQLALTGNCPAGIR